MKTSRSAALPLLFAAVILAVGVVALFLPLFDCPPCLGFGYIQATGLGSSSLYECRLCGSRGLLPAPRRLRADPDPDRHRGALTCTSYWSHGLD